MKNDSRYPLVLLSLYLVEFLVLGYAPVSRVTWIAENAVALLTVGTLIWLYRRGIQFSNWAYTLAAVFIFFHTIGGHYTFEKVPFGFVTAPIKVFTPSPRLRRTGYFIKILCLFIFNSFITSILRYCFISLFVFIQHNTVLR